MFRSVQSVERFLHPLASVTEKNYPTFNGTKLEGKNVDRFCPGYEFTMFYTGFCTRISWMTDYIMFRYLVRTLVNDIDLMKLGGLPHTFTNFRVCVQVGLGITQTKKYITYLRIIHITYAHSQTNINMHNKTLFCHLT